MPSLLAIIGTCLTAAVAASPVDRYDDHPADRDAAPWWANSSAPDATSAQPTVPEYARPIGNAGPKAIAPAPSGYLRSGSAVAGVAEVAPETPPAGQADAKGEIASFADRPSSERGRGAPGPAKTLTLPGEAAPALLRRDRDSPPVHLASAMEPPAVPLKNDGVAGLSLETTNVLRPRPAPEVVAAAATSTAPSMPIPPKPIPVPAKPLAAIAPPATSSLTNMSSALTPDASTRPLALGGHADKGILGKTSPLSAMFTVGGSLSIVLGLFLVVAWAMRKTAPRGSLMLPKEVFEILGRAPLGARQQVQLLRCGSKLLLVSITPHGTETLTEVTDPLEVDRIAGICQQGNPKSSTAAFRQVFQQVATKPGAAEPEQLELGVARRKRYRWEKEHA